MNPDEQQLINKVVDPNGNVLEQVLRIACYDEYRANATYQKVIDTFGPVTPFANIVNAELRHYTAIEALCTKYSVEPPVNDWYEKIILPATLVECCQDGVNAEIANIQMYDYLIPYVMYDDIRDVFYREQAASYNNHLPAFTRCVESYQTQVNTQQALNEPFHHHDIYNAVQDLLKGDIDPTKLTQTLSSLVSRDVMIGLAAGAAITMAVTSDSSKELFSKIFKNEDETNTENKG